eukprot:3485199-Rhodomonas_salina.1
MMVPCVVRWSSPCQYNSAPTASAHRNQPHAHGLAVQSVLRQHANGFDLDGMEKHLIWAAWEWI